MKMSKELKEFYQELQAWIDAGMPESSTFSPDRSICGALKCWVLLKEGEGGGFWRTLLDEGTDLFIMNGLNGSFPFNQGLAHWELEGQSKAFYQNPKRLAFIKEMAQ